MEGLLQPGRVLQSLLVKLKAWSQVPDVSELPEVGHQSRLQPFQQGQLAPLVAYRVQFTELPEALCDAKQQQLVEARRRVPQRLRRKRARIERGLVVAPSRPIGCKPGQPRFRRVCLPQVEHCPVIRAAERAAKEAALQIELGATEVLHTACRFLIRILDQLAVRCLLA